VENLARESRSYCRRSEFRDAPVCVVVSPAKCTDHLRTVLVATHDYGRAARRPFGFGVTHGGRKGLILLESGLRRSRPGW